MNGASEVVVITGASAGVGRAIARKFAKDRAHIALLAWGRDGLEAARKEGEYSYSCSSVVSRGLPDRRLWDSATCRTA